MLSGQLSFTFSLVLLLEFLGPEARLLARTRGIHDREARAHGRGGFGASPDVGFDEGTHLLDGRLDFAVHTSLELLEASCEGLEARGAFWCFLF